MPSGALTSNLPLLECLKHLSFLIKIVLHSLNFDLPPYLRTRKENFKIAFIVGGETKYFHHKEMILKGEWHIVHEVYHLTQ